MRGPRIHPVVIAAGGTGGHLFPAEALAATLLKRGQRVVLMTDHRANALMSTLFTGGECYVLSGAGIAGRELWRAALGVMALARGLIEARRILAAIDPAVVVAFGGYPAIAPVIAAKLMRPRVAVVLHEQNAVLGRANRALLRLADVLALSVAETARVPARAHCIITGNPVRPAIAALADAGYIPPTAEGRLSLLVLGGSLGARFFADLVPAALALVSPELRRRIDLAMQCRAEDLARARTALDNLGLAAEIAPFFPDIAARLRGAHLVIARAGASTVAELAVAGRPAILIPWPGAIDDHQTANARALAATGATIVLAQDQVRAESFAALLEEWLGNPARLAAAAAAGTDAANAAERLADCVQALLAEKAR